MNFNKLVDPPFMNIFINLVVFFIVVLLLSYFDPLDLRK